MNIKNTNFWQKISKDITQTFKLSYPIAIGQLGIILIGLTDTLMVSPLGKAALAATGLASNIFFLVAIIGIGATSVIAPLVSQAIGQKDQETATKILTQGVRMAVQISIITIIIVSILAYLPQLFGQETEVEIIFSPFLLIVGLSALPMIVFQALKNFTDGLSLTKVAMQITFATVLINAFLNYWLIYGGLFMPALHEVGAALATLISRIFMCVAMYIYIKKNRKIQSFLVNFHIFEHSKILLYRLWRLGLPAGLQLFFEVGAFTGASVLMGWLGTAALAAHQVVINLASVSYLVAVSFSLGGAIRMGEAVGKQNKGQAFRASYAAAILSVGFMAICCFVFAFFSPFLVSLYTKEADVQQIAVELMIIVAFFQLSDGTQVVFLGLLRGINDLKIPTYITFTAYWIVSLPLSYYLAFTWQWGYIGIWYGLLWGLSVSAILLTLRFYLLLHYQSWHKPVLQEVT